MRDQILTYTSSVSIYVGNSFYILSTHRENSQNHGNISVVMYVTCVWLPSFSVVLHRHGLRVVTASVTEAEIRFGGLGTGFLLLLLLFFFFSAKANVDF